MERISGAAGPSAPLPTNPAPASTATPVDASPLLQAGTVIDVQVLRALSAGRFLLALGNREFVASSDTTLQPGSRVQLSVAAADANGVILRLTEPVRAEVSAAPERLVALRLPTTPAAAAVLAAFEEAAAPLDQPRLQAALSAAAAPQASPDTAMAHALLARAGLPATPALVQIALRAAEVRLPDVARMVRQGGQAVTLPDAEDGAPAIMRTLALAGIRSQSVVRPTAPPPAPNASIPRPATALSMPLPVMPSDERAGAPPPTSASPATAATALSTAAAAPVAATSRHPALQRASNLPTHVTQAQPPTTRTSTGTIVQTRHVVTAYATTAAATTTADSATSSLPNSAPSIAAQVPTVRVPSTWSPPATPLATAISRAGAITTSLETSTGAPTEAFAGNLVRAPLTTTSAMTTGTMAAAAPPAASATIPQQAPSTIPISAQPVARAWAAAISSRAVTVTVATPAVSGLPPPPLRSTPAAPIVTTMATTMPPGQQAAAPTTTVTAMTPSTSPSQPRAESGINATALPTDQPGSDVAEPVPTLVRQIVRLAMVEAAGSPAVLHATAATTGPVSMPQPPPPPTELGQPRFHGLPLPMPLADQPNASASITVTTSQPTSLVPEDSTTRIVREHLADQVFKAKDLNDYDRVVPLPLATAQITTPARLAVATRSTGGGAQATFLRVDAELTRLGPVSLRISGSDAGGPLAITLITSPASGGLLADELPALIDDLRRLGVDAAVRVVADG